MSTPWSGSRDSRRTVDDEARWNLLLYLSPGTGLVAMVASWLIASPGSARPPRSWASSCPR